jgi:hypothetical protein
MRATLLALLLATTFGSSMAYGSHVHSSAHSTRPYYGGGHHTVSHGGHYVGGQGLSHRGGHYTNTKTANHYGHHK